MTVLVIIGLMSSAVVLTMPRTKPAEEVLSQSLLAELNIAAQDSLITGRSVAVGFSNEGYGFFGFEEEQWVLARNMNWPELIDVSLTKNGRNIDLTDELFPIVVFEPTGLSPSFQLNLTGAERAMCLESHGDGRVALMDTSCAA